MVMTPRQISQKVRQGMEVKNRCKHSVVLYNCDDVGYPVGWAEKWACLVCGFSDYQSTGGNGHCQGKFGNYNFPDTRVIIENEFLLPSQRETTLELYETLDDFFEELQKLYREKRTIGLSFRKGNKIEEFVIMKNMTFREVDKKISRIKTIIGH